ncbi:hypothetical protein MHEI_47130 [Mycobacterium heidelbergense]|nr:hypothetical protein MHEI_47130 [Mycobacterium heidelbergense]
MLGGVEHRRVAVGEGEGFGHRTLGQPSGFGQDRSDRVLVEVAVASGAEDGAYIENFEDVEREIADVGDVVAQGDSLHRRIPRLSLSEARKRTQP